MQENMSTSFMAYHNQVIGFKMQVRWFDKLWMVRLSVYEAPFECDPLHQDLIATDVLNLGTIIGNNIVTCNKGQ